MKLKHTLINMIQLILLAAFILTIIYVVDHFTAQNIFEGTMALLVITVAKTFLKDSIAKDLKVKHQNDANIDDKILQLLRYSFVEGDEVLQYQHLTVREKKIISEAEFKIILQRVLDKNPLI
jgi:hypothetical protein